jgi:propanol-preferring alcohol dehydrogenase
MAVEILRALTGARIIALDIRDNVLSGIRGQVDLALRADKPSVADDVLAATDGYGAEVVIDLVGSDDTLALATAMVAPYGEVRAIGLSEGRFVFETSQGAQSLPWGATLTRPYSGAYSDLVEVVALARAGRSRPAVELFPLERALEAFDELEAGRLTGRAVLISGR